MKRLRLTLVALCCWLISGCSSTFLYNQLDWLIPWYMGGYVDLTRDQKRAFKEDLLPVLSWHREEELQSYIVILDRVDTDLDEEISPATVRAWADEFLLAYERLEARTLPLLFDLGEQLSDEQIQEFLQKLRDEQLELEEEYLGRNEEEFVDYSYDNLEENLRDLMGRLSDEQKQALRRAAGEMTRFDASWLAERAHWLDEMEVFLQREPGWRDALRQALANREENHSSEYQTAYAHNEAVIYRAIAEALNLRSDKQDQRLRKEIDKYRRDLNILIAQA